MQVWHIYYDRDGAHAQLSEMPWWALALSRAVDRIDGATSHHFCGACAPDLLWRIPVGWPVYDAPDEDGNAFLTNSLAGLMCDVFGWAVMADLRHARDVHAYDAPWAPQDVLEG